MVVEQERKLLEDAGHEVVEYARRSDDIRGMPAARKAELPLRVTWSLQDQAAMQTELSRQHFDVIHLHNSFPLISPSILAVCPANVHVPVVATLHNYRLVCAAGTLLRDGQPCFKCLNGSTAAGPRPRVLSEQPPGDRSAGPVDWNAPRDGHLAAGRRPIHRDEQFCPRNHDGGWFPAEQITIKPHFIPSPARVRAGPGSYGLYLGRLSVEKGVSTLIKAWDPSLGTLMIAGDGPLRRELEEQAAESRHRPSAFSGSLDRADCAGPAAERPLPCQPVQGL